HAAMAKLGDDPWVVTKRAELLDVIRSCAGLWFDAVATIPAAPPGGTFKLRTTIANRSGVPLVLDHLEMPFAAPVRLVSGGPAAAGGKVSASGTEPRNL